MEERGSGGGGGGGGEEVVEMEGQREGVRWGGGSSRSKR